MRAPPGFPLLWYPESKVRCVFYEPLTPDPYPPEGRGES
jgi:hypothetical protein